MAAVLTNERAVLRSHDHSITNERSVFRSHDHSMTNERAVSSCCVD